MKAPSTPTSPSSYHQILHLFTTAFDALGKKVSTDEVEYLSGLVFQVMSAPERLYHRPEHLVEITEGKLHPIESLSILFHDLVYLQVDRQINSLLKPYLEEFQISEDFTLTLSQTKDLKPF